MVPTLSLARVSALVWSLAFGLASAGHAIQQPQPDDAAPPASGSGSRVLSPSVPVSVAYGLAQFNPGQAQAPQSGLHDRFPVPYPAFHGDPNPHEPGEQEFALPERSGGCGGAPWLRSTTDKWSTGVYLFSGEAYQVEVDMLVRGRVMDFVWARKYRSQVGSVSTQGNGWDHSYNVSIDVSGADRILRNGSGRSDLYVLQPDGTWTNHEHFRHIELRPNGRYHVVFPSTGRWVLNAFDGAPEEGKLRRIDDRNGNSLTFNYNGAGNLFRILDDLGRLFRVRYNPDGFISSVEDFTGRQCVYEYYKDGDAGGSAGDLKSCRSPLVTGTPNGNDFPLGKTTVYTYSTGLVDDRLNHNLLTITDPKGQTFLRYEYAQTVDPMRLLFDRVVSQTWGDIGDLIHFDYTVVTPGPGNNGGSLRCILNGREGYVKAVVFDDKNRSVVCREFTGFANPDLPTTATTNRPTGQLRPSDPALFETQVDYNADGLPTRVLFPNLNVLEQEYDELNPARNTQGNLLVKRQLPGPLVGDQVEIVELFQYEPGLGGCCGTNFVSRHTDGRGHDTVHTYDAAGNRLSTTHRIPSIVEDFTYNRFGQVLTHTHPDNGSGHRRVDKFSYFIVGTQLGYLGAKTIDDTGFSLTTAFVYNDRGALIRVVDPRGNDTLFTRNQLDQMVRRQSRTVTTASGLVRYERDFFYDANGQNVREDIQNVDDQGVLQVNSHFTNVSEYDTLNKPVRTTWEVGPAHDIVEETVRDANRQPVLVRYGEATNGSDPFNTVSTMRDARGLAYRWVRAAGSPDQSSIQLDYDGNRQVVRMIEGLEETTPHVRTWTKDGFNRTTSETDGMGNVTTTGYDPNSNEIAMYLGGEVLDLPGSAGNVRLTESATTYDFMDRRIRSDVQFFDTATQLPLLDGVSTTQWTWSDASQVLTTTNDNGHTWATTYDTAYREATTIDPSSNERFYSYNANSFLTSSLDVDRSTSGAPDEFVTSIFAFDEEDRAIEATDNAGSTSRTAYDSRGLATTRVDPLGNVIHSEFDGVERLTVTERVLTDTGDGTGVQTGAIRTEQTYDDSSRQVTATDASGNVTTSVFGPLNRLLATQYADGTHESCKYDSFDNCVGETDQAGTTWSCSFDLNNRPKVRAVTVFGPGVSHETTFEQLSFDGANRLRAALNDNSAIERSYNSLSLLTEERLNGQVTTQEWDGVGNEISCVYPGGRTISRTFEASERVETISDAVFTLGSYQYIGQTRVESQLFGNGTLVEYEYDGITGVPNEPGDFGVRRIARSVHSHPGSMTVIDDRDYTWDRAGNKTSRRDVRQQGLGLLHEYTLDSAYRLTQTLVSDTNMTTLRDEGYVFDSVQNRVDVIGGNSPGQYLLDPTMPMPADRQMNQYTLTPFGGLNHDENGSVDTIRNTSGVVESLVEYNARNLQVHVQDNATGREHEYKYDLLGRRIERTVDVTGVAGGPYLTRYYYCGDNVCEEQGAGGLTTATYVYGSGADDVIQMQRGGNEFYYHKDDLNNVMALSDASGAVVERYEYGDYGQPLDPQTLAPVIVPSTVGNPYLFTGRRYDRETGLYWYRTRYMDPETGRYLSHDTVGDWGDPNEFGNGVAYCGNNPWSYRDPMGTAAVAFLPFCLANPTACAIGGAAIGAGITKIGWTFACEAHVASGFADCIAATGTDPMCCTRKAAFATLECAGGVPGSDYPDTSGWAEDCKEDEDPPPGPDLPGPTKGGGTPEGDGSECYKITRCWTMTHNKYDEDGNVTSSSSSTVCMEIGIVCY